ncbi:hypothetical protein SAMN05421823_109261 [Catalinimonas alkaloidigena]|uniref:Uncharacterized protein n=1 Tax=Catalinimonas alkaloidigena TaxID=1075417 RepID=A0A1G9PPS2_9BACT|nr:hypothetical protein [Catalinimonas alkaloidigena]SDM00806.1 hypothetical protein SAMN05421823_109261 [Catalinimonas alkaloidigena]
MRKQIQWLGILSIFLMGACQSVDRLTQFNMDYESSVTVSSGMSINLPFDMMTPDVTTNSESEFKVNNTRKDLIEEIRLTSMKMQITSPSSADFSFMKSIHIYLDAEDLGETEIAYLDDIPASPGRQLTLETTSADVQEYIKRDSFTLRVEAVTRKIPAQDVDIDIDSRFWVNARILGI